VVTDEDYLKFVEELSAPVTPLLSAEAQLEKRLTEEKELIGKHHPPYPPATSHSRRGDGRHSLPFSFSFQDLNGGRAPAIMSPLLLEMLQRKKARAQKKNVHSPS
jgi:hypothetical protein